MGLNKDEVELTERLLKVKQLSVVCYFFVQAENDIRDSQESRGLGYVNKRQMLYFNVITCMCVAKANIIPNILHLSCLLYTYDAADEEDSVDLGGRRSIKKKKTTVYTRNNSSSIPVR